MDSFAVHSRLDNNKKGWSVNLVIKNVYHFLSDVRSLWRSIWTAKPCVRLAGISSPFGDVTFTLTNSRLGLPFTNVPGNEQFIKVENTFFEKMAEPIGCFRCPANIINS